MATTRRSGGLHVDVGLALQPQAAALARDAVRQALDRWHVRADRIDDAQLIASELVANALRHGSQPMELNLALSRGALTVAVIDHSAALPRMRDPGPLDERGRGLPIVASLAQTWGVAPAPGGGKAVWARLPVEAWPTVPVA
jgi:anti-sigma regulatory factor (Ser/Thr protein kinase)